MIEKVVLDDDDIHCSRVSSETGNCFPAPTRHNSGYFGRCEVTKDINNVVS